MANKHTARIRWGDADVDDSNIKTYEFDTKAELDAFMAGVHESEDWLSFTVIEDSREAPVTPARKQFEVRFHKRETSSVTMTIVVFADSPEEARTKVDKWGTTGEGLCYEEELTESSGKEEVIDTEYVGLFDADTPYAVTEVKDVL